MNETDLQDAVLALRCQLGEPDAWEALVGRWHPRLWRFVSRMVSDDTVAEDLLQTIWLRVVRSLVRLRNPDRLGPWLYGIARASIADNHRDQYRRPPVEFLDDVEGADHGVEAVDASEFLATGLSCLHPCDREAIVLHYLEGRPVAEVAGICDVPPGTIKSRLHRARSVIRKSLADEEQQNASE